MIRVRRITDVAPDGIILRIEWDKFVVGSSVFLPCINTTKAIQEVKAVAKKTGTTLKPRVVIEGGRLGVRVWRTV